MLLVGRQLLVVRVVTCAVMGKVDCGFETFSVASKLSNCLGALQMRLEYLLLERL